MLMLPPSSLYPKAFCVSPKKPFPACALSLVPNLPSSEKHLFTAALEEKATATAGKTPFFLDAPAEVDSASIFLEGTTRKSEDESFLYFLPALS